MADLAALLKRVEDATGPDREIDLLLFVLAVPELEPVWPHWSEAQREEIVPRYSESIDAALALVERAAPDLIVYSFGNGDLDMKFGDIRRFTWRCGLAPEGFALEGDARRIMLWPIVHGATGPLAILTALLRALISRETKP